MNHTHYNDAQAITNKIDHVSENGLIVDGNLIEVDAIVCATGFNLKFLPQWKIIGRNGIDMQTHFYRDGRHLEAYMCISIPNFPNYFSMFIPLQD
jgi:cation diffusion facilitator CzcD-associated flavoprotein CzcO